MRSWIAVIAVSVTALCVGGANGAEGVLTGKVAQILTDDTSFGKCMARVVPSPSTVLAGCGAEWVTFDCARAFGGSSTEAGRKLDAANLALVTGNSIRFYITDTLKHNNFCYARRADVFNN